MDTLALGYTLPAIGRVTDLHRLENVHAGRTQKSVIPQNDTLAIYTVNTKGLFPLGEKQLHFRMSVGFSRYMVGYPASAHLDDSSYRNTASS